MQPIMKVVVAILMVALLAVIGLIVISNNAGDKTPETETTAAPKAEVAATAEPKATQEPAKANTESEESSVSEEAPIEDKEQAQDTVYEGALAGMTEEEIARQALAEEESHGAEGND